MKYYFIDYENVHSEGFTGIDGIAKNDMLYLMYTDHCKNFSLDLLEKITKRKANFEVCKVGSGSKNALDFQLSSFMGYIIAKNEDKECTFCIVSKDAGFDHLVDFWRKKGISVERICNFSLNSKSSKTKNIKQQSLSQPTADVQSEFSAKSVSSASSAQNNLPTQISSILQPNLDVRIMPPAPPIPSSLSEPTARVVSANKTPSPQKTTNGRSKKSNINKAVKEELLAFLSDDEYSDVILEIINSYKSKVSIKNALDKQFRDSQKSSAIYKKLKPILKEKNKT